MQKNYEFIYESKNEQFIPDQNKKYLLYYRGCFCPPHRGHFESVERFIKYPNVKIVINQGGSSTRHGVPSKLNYYIWKCYIYALIPNHKKRVFLFKNIDKMDLLLSHKNLLNIDNIIIFGAEEAGRDTSQQHFLKVYDKFMKLSQKSFTFLITQRPLLSSLSATKFIENVNKYKNGELSLDDLTYFFPKNLHNQQINWIITDLLKHNLY